MSSHPDLPEEWSRLLNAMSDDLLEADDEQLLVRLLRNDIEFRREYVLHCQIVGQLIWHAAAATNRKELWPQSTPTASLTRPRRSRQPRMYIVLVTTMAVAVIGFWFGLRPTRDDSLGSVADIVGRVSVAHGSRPPVLISGAQSQPPRKLRAGDRLHTDRFGSATILLADQTQIQVLPGSQLTLNTGQGITIRMPAGRVRASVASQKQGEALTFVTSQSEVRVLGTELELLATGTQTEVAVDEGKVRVTRLSEGRSVEVAASQFVVDAGSGVFKVIDVPLKQAEWSEDFERELPDGWTGRFVRDGLPENSRGAISATPVLHPNGMSRDAASPVVNDGLFEWRDDSVLHVTYRVQPPEWFHIYLFARPYSGPETSLTYVCVKPDLWQASPGQWRTVSIPLSEFHPLLSGREELALGRIPTRIAFSGQGGSTGVLIDRVWVDRRQPPFQQPK